MNLQLCLPINEIISKDEQVTISKFMEVCNDVAFTHDDAGNIFIFEPKDEIVLPTCREDIES